MLGQNEHYALLLALGDIRKYIDKISDPSEKKMAKEEYIKKISKICGKKCSDYEKSTKFIDNYLEERGPDAITFKKKLLLLNPTTIKERRITIYNKFTRSIMAGLLH